YYCKIGTDVDNQKVLELYQKSAILGSNKAQCELASMYWYGKGIEKNVEQAIYWYERAISNGYLPAMYDLADKYRIGYLVGKDYIAQYNLDHMYDYGKGVKKDTDKAFYWYEKSYKQGYHRALTKLMMHLRIRNQ